MRRVYQQISQIAGNVITVNTYGATDGSTPAATIAGNLALTAEYPLVTVSDTYVPSANEDLVIAASVSGASIEGYVPGLREGRIATTVADWTVPNPGSVMRLSPVIDGLTDPVGDWAQWNESGLAFLRRLLASPTGRAAKRLSEATGQLAQTDHAICLCIAIGLVSRSRSTTSKHHGTVSRHTPCVAFELTARHVAQTDHAF